MIGELPRRADGSIDVLAILRESTPLVAVIDAANDARPEDETAPEDEARS
jgi:hypothetical protein